MSGHGLKPFMLPGPLMVVCPVRECGHATLDLDVRWSAVVAMSRHIKEQHPEHYGTNAARRRAA